ncbi:hypothetical protein ScPMuIL_010824 [Solemya velum]
MKYSILRNRWLDPSLLRLLEGQTTARRCASLCLRLSDCVAFVVDRENSLCYGTSFIPTQETAMTSTGDTGFYVMLCRLPDRCRLENGYIYHVTTDTCFQLHTKYSVKYVRADGECAEVGEQMLKLDTEVKDEMIRTFLQAVGKIVDLHIQGTRVESHWFYDSGDKFKFFNWASQSNDNQQHHIIMSYSDGWLWRGVSQLQAAGFICELKPL